MGYGSRYAEKRQKMLELRLQKVYRQAKRDLEAKFFEFTGKKEQASRKKLKLIEEGKLTEKEYREWLIGQAFQEKQWKDKIRDATFILQHSNEEALKIIQKEQMGFCAENANIEAYKIERDFGFSGAVNFSIYDSSTVQRLVEENPELLPPRRVNGKKDRAWNQGIISNSVTQSIIQGESIDKVANRLARDVASTDMKAMMRYARTAMNSARNAGRMESMRRAQDMGIKIKKEWLATHDNKTRDSHRHLDGQQQDLNKPFISDFGEIMFPGDPEAEPGDVYNCRCDMIRIYPDYPLENPDWRKDDVIDGQTYEEWKQGKPKRSTSTIIANDGIENTTTGAVSKSPWLVDGSFAEMNYDEKIKAIKGMINGHDGEWSEEDVNKLGAHISSAISDRVRILAIENADLIAEKELSLKLITEKYDALSAEMSELQHLRKQEKYGSKEYKSLDRKVQSRFKKLNELDTQRNEANEELAKVRADKEKAAFETISKIRKIGGIDDGNLTQYTNFRYRVGNAFEGETVRKGITDALNMYPTSWLNKSKAYPIPLHPVLSIGRQRYEPDTGIILISEAKKSNAHEVAHRMEHCLSTILELEKQFYSRRTKGCPLEPVAYDLTGVEYGRKDKFVDEYMGKEYGGIAYELLSVGYPMVLYEYKKIEQDQDMLNFILGIVTAVE